MSLPQTRPIDSATDLCTEAWLLCGVNSIPGALRLENGRLSYTAFGSGNLGKGPLRKLEKSTGLAGLAKQLDRGAEVTLFDVPLSEVRKVEFPWYYFSGGVKLDIDGVGFRFGFDRPANTSVTDHAEDALEEIAAGFESLRQVANARRVGKAWRAALGQ